MDLTKWISEYHGMELDPIAEPDKRRNENGILFLVEYLILKDMLGALTKSDRQLFTRIEKNLEVPNYPGLYNRGKGEHTRENVRTISHDNMTAISAFSAVNNGNAHLKIYQHGRKYQFRYDNSNPPEPSWSRLMVPRDVCFYSLMGGSKLAYLYLPIFYLECFWSCFQKYYTRPIWYKRLWARITKGGDHPDAQIRIKDLKTSGQLLCFVRFYALRKKGIIGSNIAWKICSYFVERNFGSWDKVFAYYFKNQQHPINILAKEYYERN